MGVEGSCRFPNGGGCPFLHAIYIANRRLFAPCSRVLRHTERAKAWHSFAFYSLSPPALHKGKSVSNQGESGKNRAKVNIYLLVFVSPRENRRLKTAKTKIYFTFGGCRASRCGSLFGAVLVSTGGRWSDYSCYFADVSKIGQDSAGCSAFCPLYCFVFSALYLNMPLFCVLRGF